MGSTATRRSLTFSPGPGMLPADVLARIREELLDWRGSGLSVLEMGQWTDEFQQIAAETEAAVRDVLAVPPEYAVLLLPGSASAQFAMVPMNLLRGRCNADYVCAGGWSQRAIREARRFCRVNVVASTVEEPSRRAPAQEELGLDGTAAYVHYTPSETIEGVEFPYVPETGDVPLVADCSSNLFAVPVDVGRFAAAYAAGQKHLGAAGLTVVIVREDALGKTLSGTPATFDYALHARTRSMYTTPPPFAWYVAGLMAEWIGRQGGVEALGEFSRRKAQLLYDEIDGCPLYRNDVQPACRSRTNVSFSLTRPELSERFLAEAHEAGLVALQGHMSVGGLRATIGNGMPPEGVEVLVEFLRKFATRHS